MLQDIGNHGLSPKFDEASSKTFHSMLQIKLTVKNRYVQILQKLVAQGGAVSRNLKRSNSESAARNDMKLCSVMLPYLIFDICNSW